MIAAVEGRLHAGRTGRVGKDSLEVDDAVEGPAGPDPWIDGLALGFLLRREVALVGHPGKGILERGERAPDDLDAAHVGPFDHLLVARDDLVRRAEDAARLDGGSGPADIVDPEEDHDVRYPRLAQDVTLETGESVDACTLAENAIAADPLVLDRERCPCLLQAPRQDIRPATVAVHRRIRAVGDRITERHDGPRRSPGLDHDPGEEEAVRYPVDRLELVACGEVACRRHDRPSAGRPGERC